MLNCIPALTSSFYNEMVNYESRSQNILHLHAPAEILQWQRPCLRRQKIDAQSALVKLAKKLRKLISEGKAKHSKW